MSHVMTIAEAAEYLKKEPQEFFAKLLECTDKELERKLDICREQKQMAFKLEKKDSFELLHVKEDLIIKARITKSQNDIYERPRKKPKKKKNTKKEEIFNEELDNNEVTQEEPEEKDKTEQLFFNF